MLCPHCGKEVDETYKFCPACGGTIPAHTKTSSQVVTKKRMPLWFKLLGLIAIVALIGVTAGILFTEGLVDVIDNQLTTLKNKDFDKAYYKYTSKDFQQATTLDEFKDFIKAYPIFVDNQTAHFTQRSLLHNIGTIKGNLTTPGHVKVPVEYKLIKEDGKWKILSIRLLKPDLIKSPVGAADIQKLINQIEQDLELIKNGKVEEAYQRFSSKEFKEKTSLNAFKQFVKRYPILNNYDSYIISKTTIRNNVAIINVMLQKESLTAYVKYYLLFEDNAWKIWSMRILSPLEQVKEINPEGTVQVPEKKMIFANVILGTDVNEKGIITNPSASFPSNTNNIYVNIEVINGIAGEVVHLNFQHLESRSSILAKALIQENGDSMIESVFFPPSGGWPKGKYELVATASAGLVKSVEFTID